MLAGWSRVERPAGEQPVNAAMPTQAEQELLANALIPDSRTLEQLFAMLRAAYPVIVVSIRRSRSYVATSSLTHGL